MGSTLLRTGHSREIKPRGVRTVEKNDKVPELNNQVGHEGRAAQVPGDRKKKKNGQTSRARDRVRRDEAGK